MIKLQLDGSSSLLFLKLPKDALGQPRQESNHPKPQQWCKFWGETIIKLDRQVHDETLIIFRACPVFGRKVYRQSDLNPIFCCNGHSWELPSLPYDRRRAVVSAFSPAQRPLPSSIMIPMCFGTSKGISIFLFLKTKHVFLPIIIYRFIISTPYKIGTWPLNQQGFPSSHIVSYLLTKKQPLPLWWLFFSMAESASELSTFCSSGWDSSDTGRTVLIAPNSKVR